MALTLSGGADRTLASCPYIGPNAEDSSEGCIHVIIEIPRGSRNKYEIDHEDGTRLPRPPPLHRHHVPRRLRLHPRHARRRRRPARRAGPARRPGVSRRRRRVPPRRRAVHAGRGRRGRQAHLRAAEGASLRQRQRHLRADAATGRGDPALLQRVQGARAGQVLLGPRPRWPGRSVGRDPQVPRRLPRPRRRTDTPTIARRSTRATSTRSWRQMVDRRAAPTAPARGPQWANSTRGIGRRCGW